VSVGSGPREAFCRLPDGSYEVFEEKAGLTSNRSLWVSGTASKVIDTLPFDVVPAEMGALARAADKYYDGFGTTRRCYDLEVAIRTCLLKLPILIKWQWVKGHASSRKDRDELTLPELLNETADELATQTRSSPSLTHTRAMITGLNKRLVSLAPADVCAVAWRVN
jgi:hypothetical protein